MKVADGQENKLVDWVFERCKRAEMKSVKYVCLVRGDENTESYGRISRLQFPNKSRIYITKKGWTLVTSDGKEMLLDFREINIALKETIIQGYIANK